LFGERRLRILEEELGNALVPHAVAAKNVENLLPVRIEDFQPLPTRSVNKDLNARVS
jgi:hypothetical protein